jgi:hypothetical protein
MQKRFTLWIVAVVFAGMISSIVAQGSPHGKVTWGTPDQTWGTRRPVTAADQDRRFALNACITHCANERLRKPPTGFVFLAERVGDLA